MGILSFFVALFGGAYYIGRYSYEKSELRSYDRWSQHARDIDKIITAPKSVTDLVKRLFSDRQTLQDTLLEMEDDLIFIFGDNWYQYFKDFPLDSELRMNAVDGFGNILNIAYMLWLSRRGYYKGELQTIPQINPYFGIHGVPDSMRADVAIKTCYIIERNIRRFHPEDSHNFFLVNTGYSDNICWEFELPGPSKHKSPWATSPDNIVTFDFGIPGNENPHRFESYRIN